MAYKIFGVQIKDGAYYTMLGSPHVFIFRGSGFKNLAVPNETISVKKYHRFRPYFLQKKDYVKFGNNAGWIESISFEGRSKRYYITISDETGVSDHRLPNKIEFENI